MNVAFYENLRRDYCDAPFVCSTCKKRRCRDDDSIVEVARFSVSVSCISICARAATFRQVHAACVLTVIVVGPPPTLSFKPQRSFNPSTSPEFTLFTFGIYYLYMCHPLLCTSSAYKVLVLPTIFGVSTTSKT